MAGRGRTLLAVLIDREELTHDEVVQRFEQCARANHEDATLSVRTLRRWIAGDVRTDPRPAQRRVARLLWGYPMSELLAPAPDSLTSSRTSSEATAHAGSGMDTTATPADDSAEEVSGLATC